MTSLNAALSGAAIALVVCALLSGVVAWAGPLDRPRARGAHDRATATSGGVAMMAGSALGLLGFALLAPGVRHALGQAAACLAFAGAAGLLGALDDLYDFGARAKLAGQAILSLAFAAAVGRIEFLPLTAGLDVWAGPFFGLLGTTLWLVVASNAVNFMDGADGLAAGFVAVASSFFALAAFLGGAPALGAAALAGAGAAVGFLPWNVGARRLFQGDAGALFSSFLLASLAVVAAGARGRGAVHVWVGPLLLLPLLTDVLLTLADRARHRRPLLQAHREHLYQRWLASTGKPHAALAWRAWAVAALYGVAAVASLALSDLGRLVLFAAAVAASAVGWRILRARTTR